MNEPRVQCQIDGPVSRSVGTGGLDGRVGRGMEDEGRLEGRVRQGERMLTLRLDRVVRARVAHQREDGAEDRMFT